MVHSLPLHSPVSSQYCFTPSFTPLSPCSTRSSSSSRTSTPRTTTRCRRISWRWASHPPTSWSASSSLIWERDWRLCCGSCRREEGPRRCAGTHAGTPCCICWLLNPLSDTHTHSHALPHPPIRASVTLSLSNSHTCIPPPYF